jgi:hypothetical protein
MSQLKFNYKFSKKDLALFSYCLNELQLVVQAELDKDKGLRLFGTYKGEKEYVNFGEEITKNQLGHAHLIAYRLFYKRIYETGLIKRPEKKKVLVEKTKEDVKKNPLEGLSGPMF